ncbi:MAG: hypothetical protein RIR12_1584 [Bacteroidota bacterium]
MPGRKLGSESRYGFNGKERDKDMHSLTAYDYGFRIYNPAIGKFLSVDPLTKDYPWNSTYAFAENSAIKYIDLDGLEKYVYEIGKNEKGEWYTTKLELCEAGPLGDGALVRYKNGSTELYFYGPIGKSGTTGKDFIKQFESTNKDKDGNHVSWNLVGESFTSIGYGHANKSAADAKKYPAGTKITEEEALKIFDEDYKKETVNMQDGDKVKGEALTSYSFNTTDDPYKKGSTVDDFNNTRRSERRNFIINNLRAKSVHAKGLVKRRSAEHILYNYGQYLFIDYAQAAQNAWKKAFQQSTGTVPQPEKKEPVETKKQKIDEK